MRDRFPGLYIVSETGCLNPYTGAYKHILAGQTQLQKYFDVELTLFCKPYTNPSESSSLATHKSNGSNRHTFRKTFRASIKWIYILLSNHICFFTYLKKVKKSSPCFIYERASYLNFNGILIAKLLRIPHMYEVNGVLSHSNSRYFPKLFNKVAFLFEKVAYQHSFGFYIGGVNDVFRIPNDQYFITQNGVDKEFADKFLTKVNFVKDKINLTFIGHAMPHHRLDVLADSLKLLANPSLFRLHLIGTNLESIKKSIPDSVETIFYGSLSQSQIAELIRGFHIGIITFALPYFSHVKAFMYGAAKLTLIVPSSKNFKTIFSDNEVIFIKNADSKDLAEKLNELAKNTSVLKDYGRNIYSKVCNQFTWEEIYKQIAVKINDRVRNHHL